MELYKKLIKTIHRTKEQTFIWFFAWMESVEQLYLVWNITWKWKRNENEKRQQQQQRQPQNQHQRHQNLPSMWTQFRVSRKHLTVKWWVESTSREEVMRKKRGRENEKKDVQLVYTFEPVPWEPDSLCQNTIGNWEAAPKWNVEEEYGGGPKKMIPSCGKTEGTEGNNMKYPDVICKLNFRLQD